MGGHHHYHYHHHHHHHHNHLMTYEMSLGDVWCYHPQENLITPMMIGTARSSVQCVESQMPDILRPLCLESLQLPLFLLSSSSSPHLLVLWVTFHSLFLGLLPLLKLQLASIHTANDLNTVFLKAI